MALVADPQTGVIFTQSWTHAHRRHRGQVDSLDRRHQPRPRRSGGDGRRSPTRPPAGSHGFLNPTLYRMRAAPAFHDIVPSRTARWRCCETASTPAAMSSPGCARSTTTARWPHGRGWDDVTGLGTPLTRRRCSPPCASEYARCASSRCFPARPRSSARWAWTDLLVGRSAECDYPADVRRLPVVTAARIDSAALSGASIDQAVRDALLDGQARSTPWTTQLIRELVPDLVITQDLCRVCAVSGDDVRRIERLDCDVLSLDPRHDRRGRALGAARSATGSAVPAAAAPVVAGMRRHDRAAAAAVDRPAPRRVFLAGVARPAVRQRPLAPRDGRAGRRRRACWARRARRRGRSPGTTCGAADPELWSWRRAASTPARAARGGRARAADRPRSRRRQRLLLAARPAAGRGRRPAGPPPPPGRRVPTRAMAGDQARVNRATHSMWCVCGNMSTGRTRSSR